MAKEDRNYFDRSNTFEGTGIKPFRLGHYNDSPDGEQCFFKTFFCGKIGLAFGIYAAGFDWSNLSTQKWSNTRIFIRGVGVALPYTAVGLTFGSLVCLATQMRKKDDKINYLIGGSAAGTLTGVFLKSNVSTVALCAVGGLGAMLYKDCELKGYKMYHPNEDIFGETIPTDTLWVKKSTAIENTE